MLIIFGPKRKEYKKAGESFIISFIIYIYTQNIIRMIKSSRTSGVGKEAHMREMHTHTKHMISKSEGKRLLV
jgi:hypothetical protein